MIVEGWDLHLYCMNGDGERKPLGVHANDYSQDRWTAQFAGVNKGDAWAQAKAAGWRKVKDADRNEDVICRRCRNAGKAK